MGLRGVAVSTANVRRISVYNNKSIKRVLALVPCLVHLHLGQARPEACTVLAGGTDFLAGLADMCRHVQTCEMK